MYDPLPESYSVELRTLIQDMLQTEVKKRPTANELLQVCTRAPHRPTAYASPPSPNQACSSSWRAC
jgi:hypothetical protein